MSGSKKRNPPRSSVKFGFDETVVSNPILKIKLRMLKARKTGFIVNYTPKRGEPITSCEKRWALHCIESGAAARYIQGERHAPVFDIPDFWKDRK